MPKKAKSPAYQWYPKDILTDGAVVAMTLEQEGMYRRLLDQCWLENGLPPEPEALWRLGKCDSLDHFLKLWPKMRDKFVLRDGKLRNLRQEEERKKQRKNSRSRRLAAKKRWQEQGSKCNANGSAKTCLSSSSSISSSTPVLKDTEAPAPPVLALQKPKAQKGHHGHSFCGKRFCLSHRQLEMFQRELGRLAETFSIGDHLEKWDREAKESEEPIMNLLPWLRERIRRDSGVRDGAITTDEFRRAEQIRRQMYGRCPHEPKCGNYEDCIRQIALHGRGDPAA